MHVDVYNNIRTRVVQETQGTYFSSLVRRFLPWLVIVFGSVAGTVLGILFWKTLLYWRRLVTQPFMLESILPLDIADHATVEARGLHIATTNLRARLEPRVLADGREKLILCAGMRNFREPWARDLSFASFGLVELGDYQPVRETLEVFFMHQRPTGQLPVKVHSTSVVNRYLHSYFRREQPASMPLKPKYITAHNTISLDGNALLVIAALNYLNRSEDEDFAKTHWAGLRRAMVWLEAHASKEDGLLHQSAFADWADSIARQGRVLYTNVVYWKALFDMAVAAGRFGQEEDVPYFEAKAKQLKHSVNDHFWRADLGYYVTSQIFDNLSSSGNLLAIAWNLASPHQAQAILNNMKQFDMANPVPTQVVHRAYPNTFIALENRLGGLAYYHTHAAWLWLGAWHVIALTRMDRLKEAEQLLYRLSKVIVRDKVVHEVYAPDGHYLSTRWYTSEAPFSWSAGMVVHAHYVYQRHLQRNRITL